MAGKLSVEFNLPVLVELRMERGKILKKVANAVAAHIRKGLRSGTTPNGKSLPDPVGNGKPMRASGDLVRSVKAGKAKKDQSVVFVAPQGTRDDLGRGLNNKQFALHASHVKHRDVNILDGGNEMPLRDEMLTNARKELAKQTGKPNAVRWKSQRFKAA